MNYEVKNLSQFYVAGISIRTINKGGQAGQDIGALWQQFIQGNLADKLEEKEGAELYCVYTDYESDHNDYYTAILGCKVSSIEYLPEGFVGKAIAAGKYRVYAPEGKMPQSVGDAWQHIWQADINRTYTSDFDVYDTNNEQFEDIDVKVYVAVD